MPGAEQRGAVSIYIPEQEEREAGEGKEGREKQTQKQSNIKMNIRINMVKERKK